MSARHRRAIDERDVRMKSLKARRRGLVVLLMAVGMYLSGCSVWNRIWFAQEKADNGANGRSKVTATAKAPPPPAAQADPSGAAKTKTPAAKTSEKPAETSQEKQTETEDEGPKPLTESQKEWEEKVARSPYLVSGEYFRQREPGGTFNWDLSRLFGRSKEDEQKRKSLEERLAKLEAELAAGATSSGAAAAGTVRTRVVSVDGMGPVNRVAMVAIEPDVPNPKGFGRIPLEIVASALEREPRLILVEPPLVDRALRDKKVRPTPENVRDVAMLLERDLGTQLVIFLEEASVGSDWDRRGQVQAQVLLKGEIREGVTGRPINLLSAKGTQTASGSQEGLAKVEALKQASDQLSAAILKMALEYEWSARVLSVEDGRIRINAGRRSGLQEGDLLRVFRAEGQEIYHPATNLFVGLDLGDPKGKARITDFFGADAAIARVTEGSGFSPNDLLKLDSR
jgi:hypothetical protein